MWTESPPPHVSSLITRRDVTVERHLVVSLAFAKVLRFVHKGRQVDVTKLPPGVLRNMLTNN